MGLQSTSYLSDKYFNEDDIEKIRGEIEEAQDEVLNRFPVEELEQLGRLSHGTHILNRHLKTRG